MIDVEVFCPLYAWLTLYILNYYDSQLLWEMIEVLCIKERSFIFLLLVTTGLLIILGVGSFWSNVWRSVFLTYRLKLETVFFLLFLVSDHQFIWCQVYVHIVTQKLCFSFGLIFSLRMLSLWSIQYPLCWLLTGNFYHLFFQQLVHLFSFSWYIVYVMWMLLLGSNIRECNQIFVLFPIIWDLFPCYSRCYQLGTLSFVINSHKRTFNKPSGVGLVETC